MDLVSRVKIIGRGLFLIGLIVFISQYVLEKKVEDQDTESCKFLLGVQNFCMSKEYDQYKKSHLIYLTYEGTAREKRINELIASGFIINSVYVYAPIKESQNLADIVVTTTHIPVQQIAKIIELKKTLKKKDILVVDFPFLGISKGPRFDAIYELLKLGQQTKKQLIILDRPNPLGGVIEGPGTIPFRCGITFGELVLYINALSSKRTNVLVVPMVGFDRSLQQNNKVISEALYKKAFTCGFFGLYEEIFPLDLSSHSTLSYTGLALPSEMALSHWETEYLKKLCLEFGVELVRYEYKKNDTVYHGLAFKSVKDPLLFSSFNSFLTIFKFLLNRKQISLEFSENFDTLIGSSDIRKYLQGLLSFEKFKKSTEETMYRYAEKILPLLLYKPIPKVFQVCLFNGAHD